MTVAEILPPVRFDYGTLEEATGLQVMCAADAIRKHGRPIFGIAVAIGRELLAVKAALPHGQFGQWLDAEFGWSDRTAQNYMNVAERLGELSPAKSETISVLPMVTIYQLAAPSTPPAIRDEVIEDLSAGRLIDEAAVKERVTIARQQARAERQENRSTETKTLGIKLDDSEGSADGKASAGENLRQKVQKFTSQNIELDHLPAHPTAGEGLAEDQRPDEAELAPASEQSLEQIIKPDAESIARAAEFLKGLSGLTPRKRALELRDRLAAGEAKSLMLAVDQLQQRGELDPPTREEAVRIQRYKITKKCHALRLEDAESREKLPEAILEAFRYRAWQDRSTPKAPEIGEPLAIDIPGCSFSEWISCPFPKGIGSRIEEVRSILRRARNTPNGDAALKRVDDEFCAPSKAA